MRSIEDLAHQWLELDRDQSTRAEIQSLLDAKDVEQLEGRLRKRIAFGTAGLRASMKAGFAHMNSLTVLQASAGLAQYILDRQTSTAHVASDEPKVVIGYDARHNSEKFARLAAAAFLDKGFRVLWFGRLVHTPMVPLAVDRYHAAAGVMVTASHNPKDDNGYKVYWSNGCQIIPPHDVGIAGAIEQQISPNTWDVQSVDNHALVENILSDSTQAYFTRVQNLVSNTLSAGEPTEFVYTPMHGVGLPFMKQAAALAGYNTSHMRIVPEQAQPDPEFSTVSFPNPEESGALDLAFQLAERENCSIVIANDPDADRFAAAERVDDGAWHQFTGNQMGVLLASHVLDNIEGDKSTTVMLASTVSSRMLAAMAAKEGFMFKETLTGFKWLGNVAQALALQGLTPVFAYEEAIGYMFPGVVWDKDGIAAAAMFLTALRRWKLDGITPWQRLQQLYREYGYFEDANTYLVSPSPEATNKVFADIRTSHAGSRPMTLGSRKIIRWRDLTLGNDTASADGTPDLPVDPSAQMITCELDGVVLTARGSGTEPKIKLYIEAKGESSVQAKQTAHEVLSDLLREWFKPEYYGLRLAGS